MADHDSLRFAGRARSEDDIGQRIQRHADDLAQRLDRCGLPKRNPGYVARLEGDLVVLLDDDAGDACLCQNPIAPARGLFDAQRDVGSARSEDSEYGDDLRGPLGKMDCDEIATLYSVIAQRARKSQRPVGKLRIAQTTVRFPCQRQGLRTLTRCVEEGVVQWARGELDVGRIHPRSRLTLPCRQRQQILLLPGGGIGE